MLNKSPLNQQQMAELFATSKPNISMHIANILKDKELLENSVVKNFLTTAADGKNYNVVFYSLEMIIAVGYRVRGVRGTQFRQWATEHLTEYLVKGFTMDDERLKFSIIQSPIPSLLPPIRSPASVHQKQPSQTSETTRPPIRNMPSEHENKIYMNLTKIPIALAILDSYCYFCRKIEKQA